MSEISQNTLKVRHDWYQTETHVVLNILVKNVQEKDFSLKYEPESIELNFRNENDHKYNLSFNLLHEINTNECTYKILSSKVEVKLKKKEGVRWDSLERATSADNNVQEDAPKKLDYPSSSVKQKDWDKLVGDLSKEEDELEGDQALNALFQKIYHEGSDEVKKAMNKSFFESSGTVLSTNWGEVKKDKVTVKPPDGTEWKQWE